MGKFDGYLLLSDFDGTLAHTESIITEEGKKSFKTISKENCDAIRYFQSEGGLFTLATGRQPEHVAQWAEEIRPNTYISSLYSPNSFSGRKKLLLSCRFVNSTIYSTAMYRPRIGRIHNNICFYFGYIIDDNS